MKTRVIAEIGINHNGSLKNCLKLIDYAKEAGCQAVKFQLFKAKYLYPKSAGRIRWQRGKHQYSYDIFKACQKSELAIAWINDLTNYCKSKDISFLCSVFDTYSLKVLLRKEIKEIKLASSVITNLPLIKACASTGLPLYVSTGGATLAEVKEATAVIQRWHRKFTLLHCTLKYPCRLNECNLGALRTLRINFPDIRIGLSDHSDDSGKVASQAVYLGAQVIEKHITLDKKMEGPDHFFALEPRELNEMVRSIKKAEVDYKTGCFKINKIIYGNSKMKVFPYERYLRNFTYMRLFARRKILKGERVRPKDIVILRPGNKQRGLEAKHITLFKNSFIQANKDIECEAPITWGAVAK